MDRKLSKLAHELGNYKYGMLYGHLLSRKLPINAANMREAAEALEDIENRRRHVLDTSQAAADRDPRADEIHAAAEKKLFTLGQPVTAQNIRIVAAAMYRDTYRGGDPDDPIRPAAEVRHERAVIKNMFMTADRYDEPAPTTSPASDEHHSGRFDTAVSRIKDTLARNRTPTSGRKTDTADRHQTRPHSHDISL